MGFGDLYFVFFLLKEGLEHGHKGVWGGQVGSVIGVGILELFDLASFFFILASELDYFIF